MKHSQLLAISVVALIVLAAVPAQEVHAATPYTEKLNVYVAGSSALWYFTFSGINGSGRLSAFESTPGLSWYNITAIETTNWASDFQVFGEQGYGVLPVPSVPSQGLFLTLGSDSFANAAAAASALDSYLLTSFVSLSNGTGTYSFYSPVSFTSLVPATLLTFIPTGEGGFANAISSSNFISTSSPFVVLGGVSGASGFGHTLVIGSIASPALSSSEPNIMSYFGDSSLTASNQSSSSVVQINLLGGEIESTDAGAVVRNTPQGNGSYTLTLAPGEVLSNVNATVVEQPTPLLATRSVDKGVIHTGDDIAVTLTLKDLSSSAASITNVSLSDNWWNSTGVFEYLSGNYTVSDQSIGAGQSITPVYRLKYTGTTTGSLTIPPSVVSYEYVVNGVTFNATATFNPIRLSLGSDDAVVYATLVPTGGFGKVVGQSQEFTVTATNVGTLSASSVVVAGQSILGLAPGATANVTVSQSATGLVGVNVTKAYSVTYQDPAGTQLSASTNVISDVFSQSGMDIAFPALTASAQLGTLANQETNLTLTFTITNLGTADVSSFEAEGTMPAALGCGKVSGEGVACSGGLLTIRYNVLNASSALSVYMMYNITTPMNYIIPQLVFNGTAQGSGISGTSNPVAVPAGVLVSKQFSPSGLFGGMNSTVTVTAINAGPFPAYNATVASTIDSFDSLSGSAVTSKTVTSIAGGGNTTLSYGVVLQQVSGTQSAAVATATFYLGGTSFTVDSPVPSVVVYQPLSVSITTTPASPEEGKNFMINVVITNPADVQVSNVQFALPIPSGVSLSQLVNAQISSKAFTVYASALGAGGNITASASAVAGSGITVPFKKAKLTFSYEGVTINGVVPTSSGIGITENVFVRYIIPTAFILLATLAVAFYVRRRAATVPASPK